MSDSKENQKDHSRYMPNNSEPLETNEVQNTDTTEATEVKSSAQHAAEVVEEVTHEIEEVIHEVEEIATPIIESIENSINKDEPTPQAIPATPPNQSTYQNNYNPNQPPHYQQQGNYGQNYYQQPRQSSTNALGIAGFVMSILAYLFFWIPFVGQIVWFLGLLCSAIGCFKKPRSFAIAGLVISLLGLLLFAGVVILLGFVAISDLT